MTELLEKWRARLATQPDFLEFDCGYYKALKHCIQDLELELDRQAAIKEDLPGMLALAKGVADQKWPHTMDAVVWAKEFCKRFPDMDEGLMVSWFANAIMAGYDTAEMHMANTRVDDKEAHWGTFLEACDAYGTTKSLSEEILRERFESWWTSRNSPGKPDGSENAE
jgi:hypothetical protein